LIKSVKNKLTLNIKNKLESSKFRKIILIWFKNKIYHANNGIDSYLYYETEKVERVVLKCVAKKFRYIIYKKIILSIFLDIMKFSDVFPAIFFYIGTHHKTLIVIWDKNYFYTDRIQR
jgi:hypothetical protein